MDSATSSSISGPMLSQWPLEGPSSPLKKARNTRRVSNVPDGLQRCSQCSFTAPPSSFPLRRTGAGYLKSCGPCVAKQIVRKAQKDNKELPLASLQQVPTMSLDAYLILVKDHKDQKFEFDAFVEIPGGTFEMGEHMFTRTNKLRDRLAEVTEFHWNQKKSTRGGKATVVTYHCAQLEGEQTRRTPKQSDARRRREKITRYHCGGWLKFTVIDDNESLVRIRITHAEPHPPFPDKSGKRAALPTTPLEGSRMSSVVRTESSGVENDYYGVDDAHMQYHEHDPYFSPEPEIQPREELRLFFSADYIASAQNNFALMVQMAQEGILPEHGDQFKAAFLGVERAADCIRQGDLAELREDNRSKRQRIS